MTAKSSKKSAPSRVSKPASKKSTSGQASKPASKRNRASKPASKKESSRTKKTERKESSDSEMEKEVSVDFEFFNMSEIDFHSVKQFLSVTFGLTGHSINLSELARLITEECADHVGTSVKSEGEQSDPLAFATCIPYEYLKKCQPQIKEFLQKADPQLSEFTKNDDEWALVLNERFINLPAGIASPMLDSLVSDWQGAIKEDPSFKVKYVLYLTPTFRLIKSSLDEELGLSKGDTKGVEDGEQFYYQEAEFADQFALSSITFKTATSHSTTDSRRAFSEEGVDASRRLFVFEYTKFISFVELINEKLID